MRYSRKKVNIKYPLDASSLYSQCPPPLHEIFVCVCLFVCLPNLFYVMEPNYFAVSFTLRTNKSVQSFPYYVCVRVMVTKAKDEQKCLEMLSQSSSRQPIPINDYCLLIIIIHNIHTITIGQGAAAQQAGQGRSIELKVLYIQLCRKA